MKSNFERTFIFMLAIMLIITVIPFKVFANEFNYSEIISPKYEGARTFSEGLAAVKKDNKWGYIDINEKTVIEFKYDIAYSFSENKAVVGIEKFEEVEWYEGKQKVMYWGIIDRNDNYSPLILADGTKFYTVIDSSYLENEWFAESIEKYLSQTRQFFYNGMLLMEEFDGPGIYSFDSNGKEIFGNTEYVPAHAPTEGIVAVSIPWTDFANYVDLKTGALLFEGKNFEVTRPFNQGLAAVAILDEETYNYYWTFIDRSGKLWDNIRFDNFYVQNTYGEYRIFNDNSLASIKDFNGKWGAINKKGETVLPFKYETLKTFTEGVAGFERNGKFGFVDIYGNEVIKPQFDDVSSFYNGLAVVRQGDKAYCIDKQGKKIDGTESLPVEAYFAESGYDDDGKVRYTVYSPGKYVVINKDSKFGFGEIKFTPSLPTVDEMSSWALEEVVLAIENNLVPTNLQNMYRTDITRVDFAALVVRAIEEVMGKDVDEIVKKNSGESLYQLVSKYPFKDTTNRNVIAAQALGIINGKAEGQFAPYDTISRQEAAALLMRTSKFLGQETTSESKTFNDDKDIANYAKEAVSYVSGIDVMQGKSNNNFAPNDSYSREQAYMTIYRLFNVLINK